MVLFPNSIDATIAYGYYVEWRRERDGAGKREMSVIYISLGSKWSLSVFLLEDDSKIKSRTATWLGRIKTTWKARVCHRSHDLCISVYLCLYPCNAHVVMDRLFLVLSLSLCWSPHLCLYLSPSHTCTPVHRLPLKGVREFPCSWWLNG